MDFDFLARGVSKRCHYLGASAAEASGLGADSCLGGSCFGGSCFGGSCFGGSCLDGGDDPLLAAGFGLGSLASLSLAAAPVGEVFAGVELPAALSDALG